MVLRRLARPLFAAFVLAAAAGLAPSPAPAAKVENHPLVEPYAGSTLTAREDAGHTEYKVIVGVHPEAKTDEGALTTSTAAGDLTRLFYENAKDRSPLEIFTNYKDALKKAGFEILFECGDKECGPSWASSRWTRVNGMKVVSSPMWYLAAKRRAADVEAYVAISVVKLRHQVDILEAKSMDKGLVTVTAEALRRGIAADGRVVLEGLYFDHDKATLKPESKPALGVIAGYLKAEPTLDVYIVGHTDGDGTFDYNLGLSRDRAKAVVDALVKDHAIAAKRLAAHGVGPLSPSKANGSDAGKAQNRRVEMVAR